MLLNNHVKQSPIIGLAGLGGGISSYVFLSAGGAYEISRSLRFDSNSSAYLTKTFGSTGNQTTWTWSGWVKRSSFDVTNNLFVAGTSAFANIRFANQNIDFTVYNGSSYIGRKVTSAVYRDPSAWYHIVCVFDTDNLTAADRMRVYVNGVRVTSFGTDTDPGPGDTSVVNTNIEHRIGSFDGSTEFFNGYLADVWFIDGQALEPTEFGEFDADTGIWNPKRYTGAKSGNSFHLPFSDNTSTTTLGYDDSGNSNNWTLNNFSVTAGADNDSLLDSPSDDTDTGTGIGGEIVGNYTTLNPLDSGSASISIDGNLTFYDPGAGLRSTRGTVGVSTGKWYFEVDCIAHTNGNMHWGVATADAALTDANGSVGLDAYGWGFIPSSSQTIKRHNSSDTTWGTTYGNGLYAVALDCDNGKVWFSNNDGTWPSSGDPAAGTGEAFSGLSGTLYPIASHNSNVLYNRTAHADFNFGQRPFTYTAPTGFKALNTAALPTPTIEVPSNYVGVTTYTGTGSSNQVVSGLNFQSDLIWIKSRTGAYDHRLFDSVRGFGSGKGLYPNDNVAEGTYSANDGALSVSSTGWTFTTAGARVNDATNYVGWAWKAGGNSNTFNVDGTGYSTASAAGLDGGSISPNGASVGTTQGFSICTITTPSPAGAYTFSHGLTKAPQFIIYRGYDQAMSWYVWHEGLGAANKYVLLNNTNAENSGTYVFNNTYPTASVITDYSSNTLHHNEGMDMLYYSWHDVEGLQRFGTYQNPSSSEGAFVELGFKPAIVIFKCVRNISSTSGAGDWVIKDTTRSPYNNPSDGNTIVVNVANEEDNYYGASQAAVDIVSNGFKIRHPGSSPGGDAGRLYIYAAWAESPFTIQQQQARAR